MSQTPAGSAESQWQTCPGLLRDMKAGQENGWARFVHLYTPLIYFWGRRAGLQQADAADICQSVFRAVSSGIDGFEYRDSEDSFRGWLWTITRNELSRHFQQLNRDTQPVGGPQSDKLLAQQPEWIDNDDVPDVVTAESEVIRRGLDLLQPQFSSNTWQAFWLTSVDDVPIPVVAERLGMTENHVRQARFRVLRRLRMFLELK